MLGDEEIVSLNADDLHIEELERRLETALALPAGLFANYAELEFTCGGFTCGELSSCGGMESCGTFGCRRLAN